MAGGTARKDLAVSIVLIGAIAAMLTANPRQEVKVREKSEAPAGDCHQSDRKAFGFDASNSGGEGEQRARTKVADRPKCASEKARQAIKDVRVPERDGPQAASNGNRRRQDDFHVESPSTRVFA